MSPIDGRLENYSQRVKIFEQQQELIKTRKHQKEGLIQKEILIPLRDHGLKKIEQVNEQTDSKLKALQDQIEHVESEKRRVGASD